MLRYARNLTPADIDGDDVVQEALITAWEIGITDKLGMLRLTRFAAARARRPVTRTGINQYAGPHAATDLVRESYDAEADGRAVAPQQGLALYVEQLRRHFEGLGPAQQDGLSGLADGLTVGEVAERHGRTVAATSAAISLGRQRLCQKLGIAPGESNFA